MERTLTLKNFSTGAVREVRDVSDCTDQEIFTSKYLMLCKAGDPWIVIDSNEAEQDRVTDRSRQPRIERPSYQ